MTGQLAFAYRDVLWPGKSENLFSLLQLTGYFVHFFIDLGIPNKQDFICYEKPL